MLVAVAAVRLSARTGLPTLLIYLGFGLALGESGIGIRFDDAGLTRVVGLVALAVILAEGGLTSRWDELRPVFPAAVALSTIGVLISVGVTALGAVLLLDLEPRLALLLGALVASTDAAAVFTVLRRVALRRRLAALLEAESGTNDPFAVILVVVLAESGRITAGSVVAGLVYQVAVGGVLGWVCGRAGAVALRQAALPSGALHGLAVLGVALTSFAAAEVLHASGFLAVYVAALVLGNSDLPHRQPTIGLAEALAWLAQISLFVLLGLLATPSRLPEAILPALGIGLVLTLLARPLSVLVVTTPFGIRLREQVVLSWGGLRGAVPIVLTTIPLSQQFPGSQQLFDVVFVLVVVFTLLQGPTLPLLVGRMGAVEAVSARDVHVEASPLEELHADLLQVRVPPGSRIHGVEVGELRLPPEAQLTLVVRDGSSFVPSPTTRLRSGDNLLVVTTSAARAEAERRLLAINREGRLAGWLRTDDR